MPTAVQGIGQGCEVPLRAARVHGVNDVQDAQRTIYHAVL
jgi:hypothetical protein